MSFIKLAFTSTRKRWMALFGLLLALSAPGFNLWILAWIGLIPALLWIKRQKSLQSVLAGAFWLGFCFQGLYCIWFFDLHPLTWLGFSEWGSRLTTLAGWLLIAVEGGVVTSLILAAYFYLKRPLLQCILLPVLWSAGFFLLQATPMALPWGLLEYTQVPLPLMRWLAGWIGASGLTFLLVLHNAIWAQALEQPKKANFVALGVFILPVLTSVLALLPVFPQAGVVPLPLAAVQANLPIEVIRSGRLTISEIEVAYLDPLKRQQLLPGTLAVFPEEGVVPGIIFENTPFQDAVMRELQVVAQQKRLSIAVGVTVQDADARLYNSIALLSPGKNPVQFYYKRKLVPFGEFTPYGFGESLTRLLAQWRVDYHAPFSEGKEAKLLQVGKIPVGGLVCFELIDASPFLGGFAGDYKCKGAKLLLNTSNLGWFHQNPLMEAQFLSVGQLRAAENRLPLVIASNTGISAVISGSGDVLARTHPFLPGQHQTQVIVYPPLPRAISFK